MPSNPFGGGGKAPKADPNIGRLAGVAEGLANETAGAGRSQLAWQKELDQARLGTVRPVIEDQLQASNQAYGRAGDQAAQYKSIYQPNEGIQALDAMGAGWLGTEEQGRLLDLQAGQKLNSLQSAYDAELAQIKQARARDTGSPIPVDATGPTTTTTRTQLGAAADPIGARDTASLIPYSIRNPQQPGLTSTVTQTNPGSVTTNPAQSAQVYDSQEADALARFNQGKAGLESQTGYQKELVGASKAAEDAASGRAVADATQGEGRFIAGLGMEAGRMGVDPSRILASAGARAPSAAAAAVHGGNTARFGFREQRSNNLANTVQTGRQANATADSEYGLGADLGNSAVSNVNNTFNSMTAGRTAPASWYSAGLSGVNSAGNLLNTQQNQQMAAYQEKQKEKGGFMDLLGTVAGAAITKSSKKVKTKVRRADTSDTLKKIEGMSTDEWDYKPGVEDGGRHVGPYAEEMKEIGLSDGKTVNVMDTAGLALAGVKQLTKEVRKLQAGLESKKRPMKRAA